MKIYRARMKKTRQSLLMGGLLACAVGVVQAQGIDFSGAKGIGTSPSKVLMEDIRLQTAVPNPFSPGSFTSVESGYNVIFNFDPVSLHLIPEIITQVTGAGSVNCASANIQVNSSLQGQVQPLPGAVVTIGRRTATTNRAGVAAFQGLPTGLVAVNVNASSYASSTRAVNLGCAAVNNSTVSMSPATGQAGGLVAGQFRVVLNWGANPEDLDSHLTGPGTTATAPRWHIYYAAKTDGGICGLDVDDTTSFGPETITCPATNATNSTGLRPGIYRYSVHHFSGISTIGASNASVRLELANGAVYNYTPPALGYTGVNNVWTVFELTINTDGGTFVAPVNTLTPTVDSGAVRRGKEGALQPMGSAEDASLFRNLVK